MEHTISLSLAFLLGLGSSLHCIGMCGGIISAMSYVPSPAASVKTSSRVYLVGAYNIGRIASYMIAGAIVGVMSSLVFVNTNGIAYLLLQSVASIFLLALGFHIAGLLPQLKSIETLGSHFWNLLKPLAGRLLPADSVVKGIAAGMIWGWLPCGLVYSVLAWTMSAADPLLGGLYMLAFGAGTLPSMILTGLFSNSIFSLARRNSARKIAGLLIVAMGLASFYLNLQPLIWPAGSQHEHHHH